MARLPKNSSLASATEAVDLARLPGRSLGRQGAYLSVTEAVPKNGPRRVPSSCPSRAVGTAIDADADLSERRCLWWVQLSRTGSPARLVAGGY